MKTSLDKNPIRANLNFAACEILAAVSKTDDREFISLAGDVCKLIQEMQKISLGLGGVRG